MQLVEKHIINSSDKRYGILVDELHKSKNLYNASLYAIRQEFFKSEKYIPYAKLQHQFQEDKNPDYCALPAKVAQWTMKLVDQNFRSFFNANKDYKKNPQKYKGRPRIPKYLDKDGSFVLTYTIQAISKRELEKNQLVKLSGVDVSVKTKLAYEDICCVRVIPRLNYAVVEIIYNVADVEPKTENGKIAAIDLGIDNLATVVSNVKGFEPFIISGKGLKSYNHYYNKRKANLKSIAEKRNKLKTTKRLQKLEQKRSNKINDYLHKASRYIVNQLVSNGITTLVIGNNKQWKQDINIGHVNNQNFVEIPHAKLISMLEYKCQLEGISVCIQEESYTSKCSFLDLEPIEKHEVYKGKRVHRGLFKSSDGTLINADVNGALNILRKCKPKAFADGIMDVVVHPCVTKTLN